MNLQPARDTPVLVTRRMRLRARTPADAEALYPSYADAELMRWWSHGPHESVDETRAAFERSDNGWRCWVLTVRGDDTAIGFVAAAEKRQGGVSEIGYMLGRAHWGTGLAREALVAVITRLFAEGQRRVYADTDPDNAASRALLERLGFQLEGRLRDEWETHIGVRDTTLYGLLPREWRGTP